MYKDIVVVTNRNLYELPIEEQIKHIINKSPRGIILREKDMPAKDYKKLAIKIINICYENNIELMLHYHVEVAKELKYKMIHLPLYVAKKYKNELSFFDKLGISIHSIEEAKLAESLGATYITCGHIFNTNCKKGVPGRGIEFLKEVCNSVSIPVYAIGGITTENIDTVIKAGATCGCAMSGVI